MTFIFCSCEKEEQVINTESSTSDTTTDTANDTTASIVEKELKELISSRMGNYQVIKSFYWYNGYSGESGENIIDTQIANINMQDSSLLLNIDSTVHELDYWLGSDTSEFITFIYIDVENHFCYLYENDSLFFEIEEGGNGGGTKTRFRGTKID